MREILGSPKSPFSGLCMRQSGLGVSSVVALRSVYH